MLMEGLQVILQRLTEMKWLFYRLLPMVHSPSAMRVVRVVAMLLMAAWITEVAEMNTLNFLLNQVLTVGILALVVLFQPELRRTIDHLGNMKRPAGTKACRHRDAHGDRPDGDGL